MNFRKYLGKRWIIILLLSFIAVTSWAQKFDGSIVLGLNASQIDGDLLWGYDKLGLTGGVKISYALKTPWYLSLELLYSQRGSQSELIPDSSIPIRKISLQYIELPVLINYRDWWIDDGAYYRVGAEAGLSYGYLFDASKSEGSYTVDTDDFQQNDVSFLLGANYFINAHWGFGFRYTRAITRLYKNPDTNERDLISYFLSFRSMYQF